MMADGSESGIPVLLVCPEDAAHVLGIGRTKVYELIRSVRCVRCGWAVCGVFLWPRWLTSWPGWREMRHDPAPREW